MPSDWCKPLSTSTLVRCSSDCVTLVDNVTSVVSATPEVPGQRYSHLILNYKFQSHHTNHGGSSSIYGSPSIAGSADLLSSHPPVMLKSSWFRLKPHEYTEIDDIITPDGLQNGHDNASRGIGAGAGVGHGSSDLLSASVPASQRKPGQLCVVPLYCKVTHADLT